MITVYEMLGYEQDKMKTLSSRRCNDEKQYYLSLFFGDDSNDFDEYKRPDDLYKNISHDKGGDAFQNKIVKDIPSCRSKSNVNGEYRTTHGLHSIKCGCNISSNDICKKKNALDLVDMSIQSSKNIVKNSFKRHVSGNMDFVYQFSIIDALIGIGSIIVYFLDIVTDVKVAVHYFLECHYFYGSVTAGLIIVPSLVTCCFGIHWYLIDYRMEHKVVARRIKSGQRVLIRTPTNVWFCRFFFTALQLGPVVRQDVFIISDVTFLSFVLCSLCFFCWFSVCFTIFIATQRHHMSNICLQKDNHAPTKPVPANAPYLFSPILYSKTTHRHHLFHFAFYVFLLCPK